MWEDSQPFRDVVQLLVNDGQLDEALAVADRWLPEGAPDWLLHDALAQKVVAKVEPLVGEAAAHVRPMIASETSLKSDPASCILIFCSRFHNDLSPLEQVATPLAPRAFFGWSSARPQNTSMRRVSDAWAQPGDHIDRQGAREARASTMGSDLWTLSWRYSEQSRSA